MSCHYLPIRIYYDDTDVSGVVHHSNYFKFFERGRTEALRSRGFELINLNQDFGIQFVVHSAEIDFLKPALLDQLLYVVTTVELVKHASIIYDQRILLGDPSLGSSVSKEQGDINFTATLCVAKLKLACVDQDFKPCALPKILSMEMKK